ncbi:MAG TPA: hypothetical protein VKZ89_14275 [Thermobifida alba]|nr:hypothetical protein [Thermobifida alba]
MTPDEASAMGELLAIQDQLDRVTSREQRILDRLNRQKAVLTAQRDAALAQAASVTGMSQSGLADVLARRKGSRPEPQMPVETPDLPVKQDPGPSSKGDG